jgi:LysR family glycine cleavage system transcriptional activator
VLDLGSGEADIAIRYARKPPPGFVSVELVRDSFYVVASPKLLGAARTPLPPAKLAEFPLIETEWLPNDDEAPRWRHWQKVASRRHKSVPDMSSLPALNFREEAHAIEAAIAGQGLAICSDVLVGPELANGALVPVSSVILPGYGFYIAHRPEHPRLGSIKAFVDWARSAASIGHAARDE